MSQEAKRKQPTKAGIVKELKTGFGMAVKADDLTKEIMDIITKGWERGITDRTIASRARFHLLGEQRDQGGETVPVNGMFLGSRDLTTEKKPLGKNKVQIISLLVKGDDGIFSVFNDPSSPTHFKGFKKNVFGYEVDTDLQVVTGEKGNFVTPKNIVKTSDEILIDTSKISAISIDQAGELEDYTECAVVVSISSMRPLRVPEWEADKLDTEDYPNIYNGNPVFQLYARVPGAEEEEEHPVLRASVNPVHLGAPFIVMGDFDLVYNEESDMEEEISPSFSGRKVILIGQKNKNSEYEGVEYIDFAVNAIIEITEDPVMVESTPIKKAGKTPAKKKASEDDKNTVRKEKIQESIDALGDETSVKVVRNMHDAKFFKGVEDKQIQDWIDELKPVEEPAVAGETEKEEDNKDLFGEEEK